MGIAMSIIIQRRSIWAKVPDVREVILVGYYDESVFRDFIKDASKEFPQLRILYLRDIGDLGHRLETVVDDGVAGDFE
jgi:hypothetical protein